jgi:hypothetical protein
MSKVQRLGKNSVEHVVKLAAVSDEIPLPPGVILRNNEEMVIWSQFCSTRAPDDWRDFDLVLMAKMVRIESDIRKYQLEIDEYGPVTLNDRGTAITNPLIGIIDTLQRQQLAIIRSLNMTQTGSDPRTMNGNGNAGKTVKNLFKSLDNDLLALPN